MRMKQKLKKVKVIQSEDKDLVTNKIASPFYRYLTEDNIELYCMRYYHNPQCISEEDFYNDMKKS